MEFPEGWGGGGVKPKKTLCGGVWVFSGFWEHHISLNTLQAGSILSLHCERRSSQRADVSYFLPPAERDVCETASLIVFQYPAVFQEFVESAFIGCLTMATVRNNSDWLSSGNARDNVCDLHLAGFSIDKNMSDCVLCFSTILKNNDRNLVKSRSEFKVQEEILSLQFIVHETSPYICRLCVGKL